MTPRASAGRASSAAGRKCKDEEHHLGLADVGAPTARMNRPRASRTKSAFEVEPDLARAAQTGRYNTGQLHPGDKFHFNPFLGTSGEFTYQAWFKKWPTGSG